MSSTASDTGLALPIDRMKPDVMSERCPSRRVLNHVTSRWGVLVLIALRGRTLRFSELRRRIGGVSERMLSQTLKLLEEDGFVLRQAHDVVPPHVEYSLTPTGREVAALVEALAVYVEDNLALILAAGRAVDGPEARPESPFDGSPPTP